MKPIEELCDICKVNNATILYHVEVNKTKAYEKYEPKLAGIAICKWCDTEMWELKQKTEKEQRA